MTLATCQPALLTGPFDWDPAAMPLTEFHHRLGRARAVAGDDGLLVCGDRAEFAALAYLTGFVPKLGPALAWFPTDGAPTLWFSGGPGMVGSARKLTWIEDVRALGAPAKDLSHLAGQRVALWGEAAMSWTLHAALPMTMVAMDAQLDLLRRRKSVFEAALLRRADDIAAGVATALQDGASMLSAERLGLSQGAQEVRLLPSHVAVRHGLYWGQRFGVAMPACGIGLSLREAPFPGEARADGDAVCEAQGLLLCGERTGNSKNVLF